MKPVVIFPAAVVAGVLVCSGGAAAQTIRVVNMIPATMSTETHQDSEPDITVNPNDPRQIVASAFTLNPTGATATAPVFCSQDGGASWLVSNIVPSGNGMTGDITVALSRNNVLYAGILRGGGWLDMRILRSPVCATAGPMTELLARTQEDQPYIRSHAPLGGSQVNRDHVYVGHNDWNNSPQTASFEQSLDAATAPAPAGLAAVRLERRTPVWNGPPVRQAIHPNGTAYGIYTQWTSYTGDLQPAAVATGNIVVVRDDDWGLGGTVYADLTDPSDAAAGRIVAQGVSWVWNGSGVFGQERMGDRAAIAVDPTNHRTVYVAWADRPASATGNTATLHVRRSTDGGSTWGADLLAIPGAINPQLAVNIRGDAGFLYQQLTGAGASQRWQTHFRQLPAGGAAWADFILADVPANTPASTFLPYLGDYAGLTAVGKDFYGVFSANNTPDLANFPQGVTYQRGADFTAHTLTSGTGTVPISIDPFFFHVENVAAARDFYVRDWTDSPTSSDAGLEPSTRPHFFGSSDVWNRRSGGSGGFDANDRPISEDPQPTVADGNFAFARVHRRGTGTAETVTLRFLKSEFGTGSSYVNAGTAPDPTLSFAAAEQVKTLAAGYPWTLVATTSIHTCLAVEISSAGDPAAAPSLLGRAPGWPNPDLSVIYDNNKAQRNMGVFTGSGGTGSATYSAVVHNAATRRRDVVLEVTPDPRFTALFGSPRIEVVGGGEAELAGGRLTLRNMAPGENRWVRLSVPFSPGQVEGEQVSVSFTEMVGNLPVNGFTVAVERAPLEVASGEGLRLLASNLRRMEAVFGAPGGASLARELHGRLGRGRIERTAYVELVQRYGGHLRQMVREALRGEEKDPFRLRRGSDSLQAVLRSGSAERIYAVQAAFDHDLDAYLTFADKQRGDLADVAQNMRWQADLLRGARGAAQVEGVAELIELSEQFDRDYALGRVTAVDYPRFVERSLPVLRRLAGMLRMERVDVAPLQANAGDPRGLQKVHRELLLRLEALR